MIWLWDNSVTLATIAMGVAAVVALIYAHLQISDARRTERRANANELWRETLRLAFDNPKLSDPSLNTTNFDYKTLTIDGDPELFQKYEMFVDTVLNASEEILEGSPTPEWDAAVRCSSSFTATICCRRTFRTPAILRNTRRNSAPSCRTH